MAYRFVDRIEDAGTFRAMIYYDVSSHEYVAQVKDETLNFTYLRDDTYEGIRHIVDEAHKRLRETAKA